MTELLTAAQMRAIEQAAIESGQVTGLELMERAGRGVVEAVFEEWPVLRTTSHRAVVLCGPGNNGGDGFVVARLLKEWGWEVEVFLYGDRAKLPPDARVNYERWAGPVTDLMTGVPEFSQFDLAVDALFGIGLGRGLPEQLMQTWGDWRGCFSATKTHFVAIDMPSGICADSGKELGAFPYSFPANLTVSFHRAKLGHYMSDCPWIGKLMVKSIGLEVCHHDDTLVRLIHEIKGNAFVKLLKSDYDHKFTHGHALILSGGITSGGAARLAARGALRIGAGLVTLGCPASAVITNAAQLNAIMLKPIAGAAGLVDVLEDRRINALCLGPGLGLDRGALIAAALDGRRGKPRPTVLDADALTVLAGDAALFAMLHPDCILTPHAGEFARLFPDIAAKLAEPATKGPAFSKVDATREAAKRAGCVVLFKGPDTVIASPDGRCSINAAVYDRTAPWLATAGSGDVLAGFITGLLARGFGAMRAAETAAWLHVESARSFGPGLIAEDLPEELPKVFRALGV